MDSVNELKFKKMVTALGIEREIRKFDENFHRICREFRERRKAKVDELDKIKAEIESGIIEPYLFEMDRLQQIKDDSGRTS